VNGRSWKVDRVRFEATLVELSSREIESSIRLIERAMRRKLDCY